VDWNNFSLSILDHLGNIRNNTLAHTARSIYNHNICRLYRNANSHHARVRGKYLALATFRHRYRFHKFWIENRSNT
jgi:hypothetical protein